MLANRLINLALVTALELNFPEMGRNGSSMGNEYTTTFQKVSAKELANRTGALAVSAPRKGLLNLPGEIRNQIYENHLAKKPALKTAAAFYTTSRVVRTEYMPLYFRQNTIPLQFWEFNRFIDTFMSESCASIASNRTCDLKVSIDQSTHLRVYLHSPIIDLKKLVENLISYPEIRISFRVNESYNWEARSLDEFVEVMRSKSISAWRAQTKDFESIELHTNTSWHRDQTDSYTGYFTRRPILEVYAVLTTEAADAMPKGNSQRWNREYSEEFMKAEDAKLVKLGLNYGGLAEGFLGTGQTGITIWRPQGILRGPDLGQE